MKAVIIYPGNSTLGGMTTVVNQHISYLKDKNVILRSVETTSSKSIAEKIFLGFSSYPVLIFYLLFFKPDIVIIHYASNFSFYRKSIFILICKVFGCKIACHLHGGGFISFYNSSGVIGRFYIKSVLKLASMHFVLGTLWRNFFQLQLNISNVAIVPNSYRFSSSDSIHISDRATDVIYVGRVEKNKGVFDLVQALREINGQIDICFVGRVVDRGVPENYLKGELHYDSVIELMNNSKILCLPSYVEAFPLVILEAVSVNSIVVATDVGAVRDILGEDYPFIYTPGDTSALRDILISIISNPDLAFEEIISHYETCKIKFCTDKVLSSLHNDYLKICKS